MPDFAVNHSAAAPVRLDLAHRSVMTKELLDTETNPEAVACST